MFAPFRRSHKGVLFSDIWHCLFFQGNIRHWGQKLADIPKYSNSTVETLILKSTSSKIGTGHSTLLCPFMGHFRSSQFLWLFFWVLQHVQGQPKTMGKGKQSAWCGISAFYSCWVARYKSIYSPVFFSCGKAKGNIVLSCNEPTWELHYRCIVPWPPASSRATLVTNTFLATLEKRDYCLGRGTRGRFDTLAFSFAI